MFHANYTSKLFPRSCWIKILLRDNRPDYDQHTCLFATFKFPRRRSLNQLVKVRSWIFFQLSSVFLVKVKPERPPLEVLEAILVQFSSQTIADNSKAELLRLLVSLFIEGGARILVEGGARISNAQSGQNCACAISCVAMEAPWCATIGIMCLQYLYHGCIHDF